MFTLPYSFEKIEGRCLKAKLSQRDRKLLQGVAILHLNGTPITFVGHARDKKKGDYVCVTSKEEDCYICLQFSSDQKKLKAKKAYQLEKSKDISKDLEDSLLGPDEPPTTPASISTASSVTTVSSDKSSSSEPLLLILERLDSMQGRLSALEKGSTSVSSNEVNMTEAIPGTEGSERRRTSSRSVFAVTEEDEDTEEFKEARSKRACSLSPSSDKPCTSKEEEVDDDPSYRQVLASVRSLLDLPTPEAYSEGPSKIFGSKDRRKKTPILPLYLPPVEEINNRWKELEKKVAGNPSDNGERLLSAPYN